MMKYPSFTKNVQIIFGLLIMSAIICCEKIEIDEPINCKVGVKYRIDHNLSFTIDSIRDYRCPRNLICIWPGDVDVHLKIHHNFSTVDRILNFHNNGNGPFRYDGYEWELIKVEPYPESGQYTDQKDYTITLNIKD
jgi:hypothetical protein